MDYRFTFIYNDTYDLSPQTLVIDEPKEFASGFTSMLKRDFDYHGVFFALTDPDLDLEFAGPAKDVIEELFFYDGIDAELTLKIERRDDEYSSYETLYLGQADFNTYSMGNDFVSIGFEESNLLIDVNNNIDVQVDSQQTEDLQGNTISADALEDIILRGRNITRRNGLAFPDDTWSILFANSTVDTDLNLGEGKDEIRYIDGGGFASGIGIDSTTVPNPTIFLGGSRVVIKELGDFTTAQLDISWDYDVVEVGTAGVQITLYYVIEEIEDGTTTRNYTSIATYTSTPASGSESVSVSVDVEAGIIKQLGFAYMINGTLPSGGNSLEVTLTNFSFVATAVTSKPATTIKAKTLLIHFPSGGR